MGRGSYFASPPQVLAWLEQSQITVGQFTSIALGARLILDADHNIDWVTTTPPPPTHPGHPSGKGDIVIGNDVWIGAFATILGGVTIGDGAVVGACAVVARSVPPYGIVVGNPARLVRHRFDSATVDQLLAIRWWDWPTEKIEAAGELLWSNRVAEFVARYAPPLAYESLGDKTGQD